MRNTVIMIMVSVRKMNDFVNQAIQCNQLGRPIIFIDSCVTQSIYLHYNSLREGEEAVGRGEGKGEGVHQTEKQINGGTRQLSPAH